jgi:hypothetical protein
MTGIPFALHGVASWKTCSRFESATMSQLSLPGGRLGRLSGTASINFAGRLAPLPNAEAAASNSFRRQAEFLIAAPQDCFWLIPVLQSPNNHRRDDRI